MEENTLVKGFNSTLVQLKVYVRMYLQALISGVSI